MTEYTYLIRQCTGGITIEKLHLRMSTFNISINLLNNFIFMK
jgi:hypothetical protein